MKTSQSFPFYHADFLIGTALMTCEEVGAYMRLLCHQWEQGSLPADCKAIARLAQTSEDIICSVMPKFSGRTRGKIYNQRLEEVRKSLNAYRKSRSENGQKGGRPKKHMVSECFQDAKAYEKLPIPSPIPFPSPTITSGPTAGADEEWLASLKTDPEHTGIDFDHELRNAKDWIRKHPTRRFTRRFFENWLKRAEKTLSLNVPELPAHKKY